MYRVFKRGVDVVLSLVLIVLLSPIFLIVSIIIKLDSEGPVFFTQKRYGRNGTYFNIIKFRSMYTGTPDIPTDRLRNPEAYVTRVGRVLRKTSLDELPQLFNILKGDMAFIGPRPALHNQHALIEARKRLGIDKLRPGLTGYAQVMGRDFITDEQKVQYDKYYMEHESLLLDIRIILLTFLKVTTAEGVRE
jgi:O-antigen biosynthesis protein WbqP